VSLGASTDGGEHCWVEAASGRGNAGDKASPEASTASPDYRCAAETHRSLYQDNIQGRFSTRPFYSPLFVSSIATAGQGKNSENPYRLAFSS